MSKLRRREAVCPGQPSQDQEGRLLGRLEAICMS